MSTVATVVADSPILAVDELALRRSIEDALESAGWTEKPDRRRIADVVSNEIARGHQDWVVEEDDEDEAYDKGQVDELRDAAILLLNRLDGLYGQDPYIAALYNRLEGLNDDQDSLGRLVEATWEEIANVWPGILRPALPEPAQQPAPQEPPPVQTAPPPLDAEPDLDTAVEVEVGISL
jgi:hypothetical protein